MWSPISQVENCPLFPRSFSIKVEERPQVSLTLEDPFLPNNQESTHGNENWLVIKHKRRQAPNLGRPIQGIPKEQFACIVEKEPNTKDQGIPKDQSIPKSSALKLLKILNDQGLRDGTNRHPEWKVELWKLNLKRKETRLKLANFGGSGLYTIFYLKCGYILSYG